jgi:hypothetical protein
LELSVIFEDMGTGNGVEVLRVFRELLIKMRSRCEEKAAEFSENTSAVSEHDESGDEGQGKSDDNAGTGKRAPSKSPPKPNPKIFKSTEKHYRIHSR